MCALFAAMMATVNGRMGVRVDVGNSNIYCLQYQALISINISIQHQLSSSSRVLQIQNNKFIPLVRSFVRFISFGATVSVRSIVVDFFFFSSLASFPSVVISSSVCQADFIHVFILFSVALAFTFLLLEMQKQNGNPTWTFRCWRFSSYVIKLHTHIHIEAKIASLTEQGHTQRQICWWSVCIYQHVIYICCVAIRQLYYYICALGTNSKRIEVKCAVSWYVELIHIH